MGENKRTRRINVTKNAAIALVVTFSLLVVSLVPMLVGLVLDVTGGLAAPEAEQGGEAGASAGASKPVSKPQANVTPSAPSQKNEISLPSVTSSGTYLYSANASTAGIEGIQSAAAILIDITDGKVVAQKNADEKIYPASMTKVMTLLVACERATNPTALLTVTKAMVEKYSSPENKGASVAFTWQEGYQVTVEDALHLVIYESDTYACWLLAEHIAGSEEAFVALMNDKAKSLGLTATNFTNCTGLYNDNHYTTCRDMSAIMAAVMNNSAATKVITSKDLYTVDIHENGKQTLEKKMYAAWYTGRLEKYKWNSATAARYAGNGSDIELIGGKTGWETLPTACFVTAARDDVTQRRYVCVQVGRMDKAKTEISESTSTRDTRIIYQKYAVEPKA